MDEVLKVGGPKLRKLFDEKTFIRSVATNPSKIEEVRKTFPGINVLKLDSLQIKNHKFWRSLKMKKYFLLLLKDLLVKCLTYSPLVMFLIVII